MSAKYLKRIHKEMEALKKQKCFVAFGKSDTEYKILARVNGPDKTAFRDKHYYIKIVVNINNYPLKAPQVTFVSKIYHPNVSGTSICLDVINEKWSPILGLETIVLSIQNLLNCPNPKDPLDSGAADDYMAKGKKKFYERNKKLDEENKTMEDTKGWITNSLGMAPELVIN